jgi:voltage-gated potassium channel
MGAARQRVWRLLETVASDDAASRVVSGAIAGLILLNMVAVALGTVESLASQYYRMLWSFEVVSVAVFSVEYLLRLWSCTSSKAFHRPIAGRIRYALSPFALVDLLAVLPFYVPMLIPVDLRFLRAFRLLRILRVLKLGRHSDALRTLGSVLAHKRSELAVTVVVLAVLLFLSSSVMYVAEHDAQPLVFPSIPASMWWALVALTSLGCDVAGPVTAIGRVFGAVVAVLGVGIFALPAGILASGFAEEIQRTHGRKRLCPHCGQNIDEPASAETRSASTPAE